MNNSKKEYDEDYYHGNSQEGDRLALKFYANIFEKELNITFGKGKKTLLDFGCGVGHLVKRLAKLNNSYAYDISSYALGKVKKISPNTKVINNPKDIKEKLDGIIALHVLEHIDKPLETFVMFSKLLKPKGILFMVVPNPEGLGHKLKKEKWFAYSDPTHISIFNMTKWESILNEAGFSVKKVRTDGLWDAPYVKQIPTIIQKIIFFPLPALQIILNTLFIPVKYGECLIIIAQKDN